MTMKHTFLKALPKDRLEAELPDAKPAYSAGEAVIEANRCLFCYDAPCIQACPTGIDIPGFIKRIATGNLHGSARLIFEANLLGTSCARVCPVDVLCEGACVYNDLHNPPIHIGKLQRHATEQAVHLEGKGGKPLFSAKPRSGKKVALIGAGPASLACAAYLVLEGVTADIFERDPLPGGLNTTGVAPYKFYAHEALEEVSRLLTYGVTLKTGVAVGQDVTFEELLDQYDAVFIGVGLGNDRSLGSLDGERVWGATQLIRRIKNDAGFQLPPFDTALVIGGGNTALDIARELALLGDGRVRMVYRKGEAEMSGYRHELDGARGEGVDLITNMTPVRLILGEDRVPTALEVADTVSGETFEYDCDFLVEAIGQQKWAASLGAPILLNEDGTVKVDPITRRTSHEKVYAGGDCINGGREVVNAAADGREAAMAMLRNWGMTPSRYRYTNHVQGEKQEVGNG